MLLKIQLIFFKTNRTYLKSYIIQHSYCRQGDNETKYFYSGTLRVGKSKLLGLVFFFLGNYEQVCMAKIKPRKNDFEENRNTGVGR